MATLLLVEVRVDGAVSDGATEGYLDRLITGKFKVILDDVIRNLSFNTSLLTFSITYNDQFSHKQSHYLIRSEKKG